MDIEDLDEYAEYLNTVNPNRLEKRYIRDMENPCEWFRDNEFRNRYRFSKQTVIGTILPLVENNLSKSTARGLPVSPLLQLLLTLRYYATGSFQMVTGDLAGISQPTVSITIRRVSEVLAEHVATHVKYPQSWFENQLNIQKFHLISNFPEVSGCIDGTHIPIKNPGGDTAEVFRNRKQIFSLNVQIVCGPAMEMLDIVVRYPGSFHDNTIFERSSVCIKYENQILPGKLLGDNGYACKRYLLTPVIAPSIPSEVNYNQAHKKTRNIVERCFGKWKSRFRCLQRGITTKVETAVAIICATAVLHNLAQLGIDDIDDDDDIGYVSLNDFIIDNQEASALAYRRAFIITHFA